MRLYDKVIGIAKRDGVLKNLEQPPVSFVIDNIANDYYHDERDSFGYEDYPYAIPPWDACFVEWVESRTIRLNGVVQMKPGAERSHGTVMLGAIVWAINDAEEIESWVDAFGAMSKHDERWRKFREATRGAPRGFLARVYGEADGRVTDWKTVQLAVTNHDGMMLDVLTGIGGETKAALVTCGQHAAEKLMMTLNQLLGLAFTFCHCKNVELSDRTEALQPPPKIRRRLGIPETRRYVLKINGANPSRSAGTGDCRSPAYHLCRGHFANYTAEKPLFGKLVGKFWIPAHVKGKKEHGTVEKSYEAK